MVAMGDETPAKEMTKAEGGSVGDQIERFRT